MTEFTEYLIPFLFRGIDFLASRDEDNDGLLEQDHNEDWMDTLLRDGKVVYSQACWLMALTNFSNLLFFYEEIEEAFRLQHIASQLVNSIENKMWSDKVSCYMNLKAEKSVKEESSQIIYKDIVFYVFAMSELLPNIGEPMSKVTQQELVNDHYGNYGNIKFLIKGKEAQNIKKRLILT